MSLYFVSITTNGGKRMKTRLLSGLTILSVIVVALSGCAGTGKGAPAQLSTPGESTELAKPGASTAVVTLGTNGTLPVGKSIGGIDVTLNLPPGVTVKADKTTETLPGVVVSSGAAQGAPSVAKFTPAAGNAPAQVRLVLLKLSGFSTGEFATLNLDIDGPVPTIADFSTTKVTITDINGTSMNGLTTTVSFKVR